jgi:glucose/arabinose dehydrogenase
MGRRVLAILAAAVTLSGVAAPLTAAPAAAAVSLPSGFVQSVRFSGQTQPLTAFSLLPDGGLLTAGKAGNITWVSPDDSERRRIAQLRVRDVQDVGLVGLTAAPDYATSGVVFTVYAYSDVDGKGFHRLSKWRVDDPSSPTALQNERIILDGITVGPSNVHGATEVLAATDGTLWLSIGDAGTSQYVDPISLQALDPNDPHGKVLHLNPDGSGVAANPYYDARAPRSWRSLVYASGFRSPFRFTLDPRTGAPVVADVGWFSYEEINVLRPGASYGWPCWEGSQPTPGYRDLPGCAGVGHTAPDFSYARSEGVSVTGGVFYEGDVWPQEYRGRYVFGDYASQRLWTARIGTDGSFAEAPVPFGAGIGGPVQFRTAVNGDIVYADIYTGNVVRLSYAPGNRPPTPSITTQTDPTTRTVTFDGSGSSDLDGDALSWAWDFGDPASSEDRAIGATASYSYPAGATFTARLTLTDAQGATVSREVTVAPGNYQPVLSIREATGSGPGGTFVVGDEVDLTATATDREDGTAGITWTSALVHCHGASCHDHEPKITSGPSLSTVFGDHGGDTRLIARATATDSSGATSSQEFMARPSLRQLLVSPSTPVAATINGVAAVGSLVTEGSTNSVSVPVTAADGISTFAAWEDGSVERFRQVVVGSQDAELRATYLTPIDRRYAGDSGLRTALGTPLAAEQGSADLRWRDYQHGRVYWTPGGGVRVLAGAIRDAFLRLGAHLTQGVPLSEESGTPDGVGRFVHFSGGVSIYWTPNTGAHAVGGAIRQRWEALGWETGPLGYPLTSESVTPDGIGRYNHFSKGGSIYWTPQTGAHGVWGAIRQRWASLGWERSYLGYPRSSEFSVPGGRRNDFRHGYVTWTARTGGLVDRRY